MTVWCGRCQSSDHAEEWHSFAYRRWWLRNLWSWGTRRKKGT